MVILTRATPEKDRSKIFGFNFMLLNLGLGTGGLISSLIIRENSVLSFQIMYWVDGATYLPYLFTRKDLTVLTFAGVILLTFGYGSLQSGIPI